jgi:phosphatidylglycerophosphate synthase
MSTTHQIPKNLQSSKTGHKIPLHDDSQVDAIFYKLSEQIVPILRKVGLTPNMLTILGGISGITASYFLYQYRLYSFSLFWLISFFFDCGDGYMARKYQMESQYGDYLDHITDNIKFSIFILVLYFKYLRKFSGYVQLSIFLVILLFGFFTLSHTGCREVLSTSMKSDTLSVFGNLCQQQPKMKIQQLKFFGIGNAYVLLMLLPIVLFYSNKFN